MCEADDNAVCHFFFQAEDGIRDLYVTGVQTCALPIFDINGFRVHTALNEDLLKQLAAMTGGEYHQAATEPDLQKIYSTIGQRSEERRVGKECRSRWSAYH